MFDTRLCALILREQPEAVLQRLAQAVLRSHRIVVSAITWAEISQAASRAGPGLAALSLADPQSG